LLEAAELQESEGETGRTRNSPSRHSLLLHEELSDTTVIAGARVLLGFASFVGRTYTGNRVGCVARSDVPPSPQFWPSASASMIPLVKWWLQSHFPFCRLGYNGIEFANRKACKINDLWRGNRDQGAGALYTVNFWKHSGCMCWEYHDRRAQHDCKALQILISAL
jgi:hypothetical protein